MSPTRRTARRRGVLIGAFLVVAAFFLGAPAAYADVPIDQVASALLASPVYVEEGNEAGVTSADEASLLGEVQSAGTPLYVAVVKADSLGGLTIAEYTHSLGTKVGVQGTYAVVAGRQFYADSQTLQGVGAIATASVKQNSGNGATAILGSFVSGVTELAADPEDSGVVPGSNGGGGSFLPILLVGGVVVAGIIGFGVVSGRRTGSATPSSSRRCGRSSTRTSRSSARRPPPSTRRTPPRRRRARRAHGGPGGVRQREGARAGDAHAQTRPS